MKETNEISQRILQSSRELLLAKGAQAVTMREIAKRSDIALGTIYNYYENKDDIIIALVEGFWQEAMAQIRTPSDVQQSFPQELAMLYQSLYREFSVFQQEWLSLLQGIGGTAKEKGLKKEQQVQQHLCQLMTHLLEQYHPHWAGSPNTEALSAFLCHNIFSHLLQGKQDISTLLEIITIVLQQEQEK